MNKSHFQQSESFLRSRLWPFVRSHRWLVLILVVVYGGCSYWRHYEYRHYESFLPEVIEVDKGLSVGSKGLFKGCGVAMFRLSPATLERLRSDGLATLKGATRAKGKKPPYTEIQYREWKETPYDALIFWNQTDSESVTGPNCVDIPDDQKAEIRQALMEKGSYYTGTKHSEILVIPSLELAILSYDK